MEESRWRNLQLHGAMPQRLLWASTAPKNSAYPPLLYVESLIAPDTVNTLPPKTLTQLQAHARITRTLSADAAHATVLLGTLRDAGIDLEPMLGQLQQDGIDKFRQSYAKGIAAVGAKRNQLRNRVAGRA